jgi:hypothetical protein
MLSRLRAFSSGPMAVWGGQPFSVDLNHWSCEVVMLEPQIRKRIEDWTLILAVWFIETNGRGISAAAALWIRSLRT